MSGLMQGSQGCVVGYPEAVESKTAESIPTDNGQTGIATSLEPNPVSPAVHAPLTGKDLLETPEKTPLVSPPFKCSAVNKRGLSLGGACLSIAIRSKWAQQRQTPRRPPHRQSSPEHSGHRPSLPEGHPVNKETMQGKRAIRNSCSSDMSQHEQ